MSETSAVPAQAAPSDSLRDLYDYRAELQYGRPVPLPDPRLDRKFERTLELLAERLPCESFLDAGCGDGRFLVAVARLAPAARLVGVDLSARILETAAATAAAEGVSAELAPGNLEALPLEDGRFDLVLCSQAIEHVLDPDLALRELARVTAPGGVLVLTTLNRRMLVSRALNAPRQLAVRALALRRWRPPDVWPELLFDRDDLAARCAAAGFSVEATETFRFHLLPPLHARWLRRVLNALDRRLPPHGVGDILVVVARRPG